MLTREQALNEAQKQKTALATIGSWRRVLFVITSTFLVLAVFGLRQSGWILGLGIAAAVIAVISCISMFVVNLSIRNGNCNVEKILQSLQSQEISKERSTVS